MALTFEDLQPGDFKATSIEGGLAKLVRIWEHLRDLNVGGYGGAVLVDVKNAVTKGKTGVTSCSPFTATCIYMALDSRPFDPGQPWSTKEPYQPLFDGGRPLDVNFYRLHNGFSLSSYASVKDKKFAAWKADFKKAYVDRLPQLAGDFSAFNFINHSAGSVIALNLGKRVDPKQMRRGDMVGIDWHNGNGHATFCWNVHLDKNGDVDCFQFVSSNGTAAGGGAGITLFRYPDVDPAYLAHSGGKYTKKNEMFSKVLDDPRAYPEYIQRPYWWFGLPGVKKGDIDLGSFGVPAKTVQISYADTLDVSVHQVHVARLHGVTPPEPYLRAEGGKTPPVEESTKAAPLAKVSSKRVDDGNSKAAAANPRKDPPKATAPQAHPVQADVELNLATLWTARWIDKDPGDHKSINDAQTQAAIRDYQEKFMKGAVPQLGHADPTTRQRLARAAASALAMPMVNAALTLAHARGIIEAAPGANPLQLDDATRAAVKEFQRKKGLEPDGIPGHDTQEKLSALLKELPKPAAKDVKAAITSVYFTSNDGTAGKTVTLKATATPACDGQVCSVSLFDGKKTLVEDAGKMKLDKGAGQLEVKIPPGLPDPSPIFARLKGDTLSAQSKAPVIARSARDDTGYWFADMKGFLGSAFAPTHPLWMPDPRPGNEVKILLDGQETYREMVKALDPDPKKWPPGSFIYLANWIVYDDFNLDRDPEFHLVSTPRTTLRDFLQRASDKGVTIRALFWDRVAFSGNTHQNDGPRDFINGLRTGHAILDGRVINTVLGDTKDKGSHHQKLLLINGPEGLVAFAGGVDFHPNRVLGHRDPLDVRPGESPTNVKRLDDRSAPLLDVHVRIRGPAAYDLLDIFLRRYADHPSAAGHEVLAPYRDYKPLPEGGVTVRVCATFGDKPIRDDTNVAPSEHTLKLLEGPQTERNFRELNVVTIAQDGGGRLHGVQPYSFAPRGRQSGRAQLLYAISSARKFIYFEDQYMVGQEIAEAISDVVRRYGVKVLGLIPHQTISTDFDDSHVKWFDVLASTRLSRVITVIHGKDADPKKLTFLFSPLQKKPDPEGSIYQYVHSKVFIMDDAFCTIGSMNFNRRSTTHDSELSVGFFEPGPKADGFAKRLRLRLWGNHLRLPEGDRKLLDDPLEAIDKVWSTVGFHPLEIKSPGGSAWRPAVVRYDWRDDTPLGGRTRFVDPIGAGIFDETEWVDKVPDPVVTSNETKSVPTNKRSGP